MSTRHPSCTRRPAERSTLLHALVVAASLLALLGCRPPGAASPEPPPRVGRSSAQPVNDRAVDPVAGPVTGPPQGLRRRGADASDGVLPHDVTPFQDRYPGVNRLDPELLASLRRAARGARGEGVELYVNSGWRSPAYQERLLDDAVARYGSRAEAARWVATPATSPHVSGDAVDIGQVDAATWLSRHGAHYALCQVFANEPWHFELRPRAVDQGCPTPFRDPTDDPRMRR